MGMHITAVGTGVSLPPHEFPQEAGAPERVPALTEEQKAAILAQVIASLPGGDPERRTKILAASEELQWVSQAFNKRLEFIVDHESHDVIVKVIDRLTDEVIKVLPPEELQRMCDGIKETVGFLFDERV